MDINMEIYEWFGTKISSYIKFWVRYYDFKIKKTKVINAIWPSGKSTVAVVCYQCISETITCFTSFNITVM